MAYDEELADRIRELMFMEPGLTEKKMFGGLAFLINGNMSVSASGRGGLMLRCPPEETETLIADEHCERMVMRGKAMDGWLRVDEEGILTQDDLRRWVRVGANFARSLPAK